MFEGYTYETVLRRMIDRLPHTLDRREGSFLYAALAPTAWELSEAYANLERALSDGFAATATRESLILLGKERGIAPYGATYAVLEARFLPENVEIPLHTRCSVEGMHYTVTAAYGRGRYALTCETPGEEGNLPAGEVLVLENAAAVESASIVRILTPGAEEEETEAFRARYFETLTAQAFGGNRADYSERIGAIQGVGNVKILPAWDGEGTVKAVICDETGGVPSDELIQRVQAEVDGFAPIGHTVTVAPIQPVELAVSATLILEEGADRELVETAVMDALVDRFALMQSAWNNETETVIRISKIHACILNCNGVAGVTDLEIGSVAENISLSAEQMPVLGEMVFV